MAAFSEISKIILRHWNFYTTPRSTEPDEARKEYITRVVFYFATILDSPTALISVIVYQTTHLIPINVPIASTLAVILLFISWRLINRGKWHYVRYLLIGYTYLVGAYISFAYGFSVPGTLFFVAALLFAAMVTPPKVLWITSALSIIALLVIIWGETAGLLQYGRPLQVSVVANIIVVFLLFTGVGALLHFLTHQFENALIRAEANAQELKAYQAHLETLVAERTAQLEKEVAERRASEAKLAKAQHIAKLGHWEWDIQEGLLSWSKNTQEIFHLAPDDFGATIENFLKFVPPDDVEMIQSEFWKVYHAKGKRGSFNHRVILPNGETRMLHQEWELVAGNTEHPERIFGVAHDITERWQAETELKASLEEKIILLKEIHHRVKNNLQIIASLLYLQSQKTDNPIALEALQNSYGRVQSMALVHETLYQSGNLAAIDFGAYIHTLISHLKQSHQSLPHSPRFEMSIAPIALDVDKAIPCGLILNELITNALKYAFKDGETATPTIRINIQVDAENKRHLLIADNGIGLPETAAHTLIGAANDLRKSSLGMTLIRQLARQIHADIRVDTHAGTCIELVF